MSNEAFYLKDETHFNIKQNKKIVLKDQLYFKSQIKSHVPEVKGDLHDDRATQQNTITYQKAWDNFKAANGGFVTPWGEEIPKAAPVVEEKPAEEEKASPIVRSSSVLK